MVPSRSFALGAAALFLLLLLPLPSVAAQTPAIVAEPAEGNLATAFAFRVPAELRVGEEALANPGFDDGGASWRARGDIVPTFEDGAARFVVASARAPGVSTLEQEFALEAAAYEISVRAAGTGTFAGFSVALRESGGTETLFRARPAAEARELRWLWHPQDATGRATLAMALQLAGGDSADVTLLEARVTPVTDVAWDFGDGTSVEHGFDVQHRFARAGSFDVAATLRHPGEPPQPATARVIVENVAPTASVTAARIGASARFLLDASSSKDPDGVETRIRNADFSLEDPLAWELGTGEIQAQGALAVEGGALHLTTEPAGTPGTAFAWQAVPIVPGRAYQFDATVRDDGNISSYVFLLRETGSARGNHDHVLEHAPVGDNATRVGFTFTPRHNDSTRVVVHLRVALAQDTRADVWFDDVSLRDGLRYDWSLDGKNLTARQAVIDVTIPPGHHVVRLNVTDVAGATVAAALTLNGTLEGGEPLAGIEPPLFAHHNSSAIFRGAPSRPGAGVEALLDPTFERGLAAWDLVQPQAARITATGGSATLAPDAASPFPAELSQRVPIDPAQTYELHLRHRGAVGVAQAIIRELHVDAGGRAEVLDESVEPLLTGDAWRDFRARWTPSEARATHAVVIVRAAGEGALQVADPSFAPLKRYLWQFNVTPTSHTPAEGYGVRHFFMETGLSLVTLQVEDASGRRNGTSVLVPVLNASDFEARANLGGGVHLSWPNLHAPATWSHFELDRREPGHDEVTTLQIPIAGGIAFTDGDAPPGRDFAYDLYIVGVNGTRALAATANVTLAAGAPRGAIDAPDSVRRFGEAEVEVSAPFDATQVEGTLSWGFLPLGKLRFVEDEEMPGRWRATYSPGFFTPPVPVTLRVEAVDAAGARATLATDATIHVELLGAGWLGILLVLGALGLPLAAWGVRRLRARGRIAWLNEPPPVEEDVR